MEEAALSDEDQAYFTRQLHDSRRIRLVGGVAVALVLLHEFNRLRELGFDASRWLVYLVFVPLMVFGLLVLPVLLYRKASGVLRSYQSGAAGSPWRFETMQGEVISSAHPVVETEKTVRFRGRTYLAKTFRVNARELWFPLSQKS